MNREAKLVDPDRLAEGAGVMGRMAEILTKKGYQTNSITIDLPSEAVEPPRGSESPLPTTVSSKGPTEFYRGRDPVRMATIRDYVDKLNNRTSVYSNFFGEAWSETFSDGVQKAAELDAALSSATLGSQWGTDTAGGNLAMIAKLMQTAGTRQVDRDFYYALFPRWDDHNELLRPHGTRVGELNDELSDFVTELKTKGLWNSTTVIVFSEFARTLTPNANLGTDHAWGGNYFLMGGDVAGGRIKGTFPDDLTDTGKFNVGRGRMLPTTSWEAVWNGVSEWMGVTSTAELDDCLPNRNNVGGGDFTPLFTKSDLYLHNPNIFGR